MIERTIVLLLTASACTEHGSGGGLPVPDAPSTTVQTGRFFPQQCTGTAGDPNCPINRLPLDELGVPGASISFVMRPLGSLSEIQEVTLATTSEMIHVDHPAFVVVPSVGEPFLAEDVFADVSIDVLPGTPVVLPETATISGANAASELVIRFDSIGGFDF